MSSSWRLLRRVCCRISFPSSDDSTASIWLRSSSLIALNGFLSYNNIANFNILYGSNLSSNLHLGFGSPTTHENLREWCSQSKLQSMFRSINILWKQQERIAIIQFKNDLIICRDLWFMIFPLRYRLQATLLWFVNCIGACAPKLTHFWKVH